MREESTQDGCRKDGYHEGGRRGGFHVRGQYVSGEVQTTSKVEELLRQRIGACVPSPLGDTWNMGGHRVPHAVIKEGSSQSGSPPWLKESERRT